MNLILCNGFNYYNRIIKKFDTYSDYYEFMDEGAPILENINFNPADGINARQVVNWDFKTPDYIVCVDENNNIDSRWFVIDSTRTRAGQLQLDLHRDVISDYYDHIIDSPVYIEKATVPSISDVAIYNKENIQFNQIKKSEEELSITCPWIVGFMANNTPTTSITISPTTFNVYGEYADQSAFYSAIGYNGTRWRYSKDHVLFFNTELEPNLIDNAIGNILISAGTGKLSDGGLYTYDSKFTSVPTGNARQVWINELASKLNTRYSSLMDYYYTNVGTSKKNTLEFIKDKIVKIGSSYKKVKITSSNSTTNAVERFNNTSGMFTNLSSVILSLGYTNFATQVGDESYGISYAYTDYFITLETYNVPVQATTQISSSANKLQDAPYKMFAIPYGYFEFYGQGDPIDTTDDEKESLNIATQIITALGSNVYDVQLLPYFPGDNYEFDIEDLEEHEDYDMVMSNDSVTSIIIYPKLSTFTFDINYSISLSNTVENLKITNQCDIYRICSPNYASVFEFNPLKTGSITKFNVDCTYKPYSSYIHVNPVWSGLYGKDYNDIRGLICQGDFSLPIINDQWKQYQINNKNYLNSFNREIDTIELQNKYAKIGDILGATAGAIGTGVNTGTLTGIGGGIASGIASSVAGGLDVAINEKLRNDALDLRKDQFNYSLDNIKALPKTLARVSAFDANNKLYPILEYYTCTDQEKEIFKDKMKYNGMTIGRIDYIKNFLSNTKNYIKGQLIRLEGVEESTVVFNSIAEELYKGVYI